MSIQRYLQVLTIGLALSVITACGGESETQGPTGQVALSLPRDILLAAPLNGETVTLDIVNESNVPVIGSTTMTPKEEGGYIAEVKGIPVGTWTFRVTYKARYKSDNNVPLVVVAEATKEGEVQANKDNQIQLDWLKTNFFDDTDAATNLEEVLAGTDPQNSGDWPVLPVAVEAGGSHSLALRKKDSRISSDLAVAWGMNTSGELGNCQQDATSMATAPVRVGKQPSSGNLLLTDEIAVSGGGTHSLAIKDGASAWAWGSNALGQLGTTNTLVQCGTSRPLQVMAGEQGGTVLTNVAAVSAGGTHSLALTHDGTVWAWGSNAFGQLGNCQLNNTEMKAATPVRVGKQPSTGSISLPDAVAVSAGGTHSLALTHDGSVWAWGSNASGQLGTTQIPTVCTSTPPGPVITPVRVIGADGMGLTRIVAVSAGGTHSLALTHDGTVWAWGSNAFGQLGTTEVPTTGTENKSTTPRRVMGPEGSGVLKDVWAVSAGNTHSLALKGDGTVWAWGGDTSGQLGDGTPFEKKPTPVQVVVGADRTGFTDVVALSAGGDHSLALKRDGSVWAWGSDRGGQLGDGDPQQDKGSPVEVDIVAVP